ncbi:hypothetical protein [Vibrio breoganii]|uniref:hypothetical protein n=1 Tax=Vibrio breoganii TaxID=553239 RepID=UPI0002E83BC0|nr:hypothetical protein [Vibrio breoganii]PMO85097.1 hypothetical protein BCS99_15020 [Vibrio breoganii]
MIEHFDKNGSPDDETLKEIKGLAESNVLSESDYRMALKRIEALFDAKPGTTKGDGLEQLASLVEAYEDEHFPF